jgi:flagellin-like hook-associated protein FlgL
MKIYSTVTTTAHSQMAKAGLRATNAVRQIASGSRLVTAGIDPAAVRMASVHKANIRGLRMSAKNAQQSAMMLRAADNALATLGERVIRMRELTLQAANGTLDDTQRSLLQIEYEDALRSIDDEAKAIQFNGIGLLNAQGGSAGQFHFSLGAQAQDGVSVQIGSFAPFRDPTGFAVVSPLDKGAAVTPNVVVNDTAEGSATNGTLRADALEPTVAESSTISATINPLRGTLEFSGTAYHAGQQISINRLDDSNDPNTPGAVIGSLVVTLARAQGSNVLTDAQVAAQVARAFSRSELAEFEFASATASGSSVNFESISTTGTGANQQAAALQSNNWNTTAAITPITVDGVAYSVDVSSAALQPFSTTPQTTTYAVRGQFDAGDRIQFSILDIDKPGTNSDQWATSSYVVQASDVYDATGQRRDEKDIRDKVIGGFLLALNGGQLGRNVTASVSARTSDVDGAEVVLAGTGLSSFTTRASVTQSRAYDVQLGGQFSADDVVSITIAGTKVEYVVGTNGAGTALADIAEGLAQSIIGAGLAASTIAAVRVQDNTIVVTAGQSSVADTSTGANPIITSAPTLSIASDVDEVESSSVAIGSNWEYGDALTITVNSKSFTYDVQASGLTGTDLAAAIADPGLRINGQTIADYWGVASVSANGATLEITSNRLDTSGSTRLNVHAVVAEAAVQRIQISGDFLAGDILKIGSRAGGVIEYKVPTATSDPTSIAAGFESVLDVESTLRVRRVEARGDTIEVTGLPGSMIGLTAFVATSSGELSMLADTRINTASRSSDALKQAHSALEKILSQRAHLGAAINRLESASNHMLTAELYQTASLSQISDADIPTAVADLVVSGIISNGAQAVLAQANTSARAIITLLQHLPGVQA